MELVVHVVSIFNIISFDYSFDNDYIIEH